MNASIVMIYLQKNPPNNRHSRNIPHRRRELRRRRRITLRFADAIRPRHCRTSTHLRQPHNLLTLPLLKLACCSGAEADSPSDRRRRLDAVNSLPRIPYGGTARQRIMTDDCPICLTEFREGESVKLIPCCGHVFHPRCLDTWLDSHVTCPVCRSAEWEEICLDVARGGSEDCATGMGEGSTAENV